MGFPISDVLTDESIVCEFTCKICCNLVEYGHAVHTHCSHVFCESCLADWVARSSDPEVLAEAAMNGEPARGPRCPTCNAGLAGEGKVAPLQTQPLAWRLLGRVQVRCPLHDSTSCGWRGDLSEVSAHLTNSESHLKGQDYAPSNATQNAEALKNQGNAKFQSHAYREAIQLYSKAISAAPGVASYYGNRAAAWLMVGAAEKCAEDCRRSIQLDSGYVKGYVRLAKALVELSDIDGAEESLRNASTRCPGKKEIEEELARVRLLSAHLAEGERALDANEPARALEMYAAAARVTQCTAVTLGAARAEIALGRCDGAMRTTGAVIRAEPGNVRAYAARGHALCLKLDFDQGMKPRYPAMLNPS